MGDDVWKAIEWQYVVPTTTSSIDSTTQAPKPKAEWVVVEKALSLPNSKTLNKRFNVVDEV